MRVTYESVISVMIELTVAEVTALAAELADSDTVFADTLRKRLLNVLV